MIRKLKSEDRDIIESMLARITQFKKTECDVAMELIDIAIFKPSQQDYFIYVFEEDDQVLGYYCTGQRPLTDGVFDLYWIAVDPAAQGKGIGKKLLKHNEELVSSKNARWLLAETSSRDDYKSTRDFYLNNGYSLVAQINNFYSLNDNLIIFGKYF